MDANRDDSRQYYSRRCQSGVYRCLICWPVSNLWPALRLLTEQHLHSLLPMSDLISAMEVGARQVFRREVLQTRPHGVDGVTNQGVLPA